MCALTGGRGAARLRDRVVREDEPFERHVRAALTEEVDWA
jgi:hypothetical protein